MPVLTVKPADVIVPPDIAQDGDGDAANSPGGVDVKEQLLSVEVKPLPVTMTAVPGGPDVGERAIVTA